MSSKTASIIALVFAAASFGSGAYISNNILQAATVSQTPPATPKPSATPTPPAKPDWNPLPGTDSSAPGYVAPKPPDTPQEKNLANREILKRVAYYDDIDLHGSQRMWEYAAVHCNSQLRTNAKISTCADKIADVGSTLSETKKSIMFNTLFSKNFAGERHARLREIQNELNNTSGLGL